MKPIQIESTPDKPIGFGLKNQWIATKAPDAKSLADALKLKDTKIANWKSGFVAAYTYPGDYVFVTPPLDEWVLAVGMGIPDPSDPAVLPVWRRMMKDISSRFGEAQFFATHRVSSYTAWGIYRGDIERRLFAHADEPIYNFGEPLPEEAHLIAHLPNPSSPEAQQPGYWDREDLRWPGEEDVLRLAQAWSIDPFDLGSKDFPASVGLVGSFRQTKAGD
jgi:hypothetical protein